MKNLKDFLTVISQNRVAKSNVFGENKAIFITGGPGSGKDVVIREVLSHIDITEVNHMQAYNYLADKKKLFEKSNDFRRETIRNHYPLLINAPADNFDKISYIKEELEELGYSTIMVFVNTLDSVSKERNEHLSRMMVESVRHSKWMSSQNNKKIYKDLFENFVLIDNNNSIELIEEDIERVYKRVNRFLVSENKNPTLIKLSSDNADSPSDITPDNRGGVSQHGDDIKSDTPARKNPSKTYTFRTYSENKNPKMIVSPQPKETNFSKDKETVKKKRITDSPTMNQRMRNVAGIGPEFDTRQQGTVYPMSGLGDVTYRESRDFKNFRNKLKEAIDDPGAVDMGVGGVLGGASNKEPMQSYNDQDKKIGIKITKKGKKNV